MPGVQPRVPSSVELPDSVNGWTRIEESPYNGLTWADAPTDWDTVVIVSNFDALGGASACVRDERVSGGGAKAPLDESIPAVGVDGDADLEPVLTDTLGWLDGTAPSEWQHPDVVETVFVSPPGYYLESYCLGARTQTVEYRRLSPPDGVRTENLLIEGYPSSGNFDVVIEQYHTEPVEGWDEVSNRTTESVALPEECGLEKAVTKARSVGRERAQDSSQAGGQDHEGIAPTAESKGSVAPNEAVQADLGEFTAGGGD